MLADLEAALHLTDDTQQHQLTSGGSVASNSSSSSVNNQSTTNSNTQMPVSPQQQQQQQSSPTRSGSVAGMMACDVAPSSSSLSQLDVNVIVKQPVSSAEGTSSLNNNNDVIMKERLVTAVVGTPPI